LYTLLFKLEDLSNSLARIPETQQQQEGEAETNTIKTEPELISMMLSCLQQLIQDDKLASMLSIRKGKVN
jgi:glutathionylspermidine synthase